MRLRSSSPLLLLAAVLAGCQSQPHGPVELRLPDEPNNLPERRESVSGPEPAVLTGITALAAIEQAYARRQCAVVLEQGRRIGELRLSNAQLPLGAQVALAVCNAELAPDDAAKNLRALEALASAEESLPPFVDKAELIDQRAERYLAKGERASGLKEKRRARLELANRDRRLAQLDVQILQLSDGIAYLNTSQQALWRQAVVSAQQDGRLFEATRQLDELLAGVASPEAREVILAQRKQVQGRIEQLFALEAAQLEDKRASGREAELRLQAEEMRARFPAPQFQARIDALLRGSGAAAAFPIPSSPLNSAPASVPEASAGGNTASPQPSPEGPVSAEKATADARAALDAGNAEEAIRQLDAIPQVERNERVASLRRQAAEVHVRELRFRVSELYRRASGIADPKAKGEALRQSKQLLEMILQRYPDTSSKSSVERNLKSINLEIEELSKAKR